MSPAVNFVLDRWFASFLTTVALGLLCLAGVLRMKGGRSARTAIWLGILAGLVGLGGLLPFQDWWAWVAGGALVAVVALFLVLLFSGRWSPHTAAGVFALLLVSLGGLWTDAAGEGLSQAWQVLLSLRPLRPWWLLLLGCVPWLVFLSYRSLAGLGPMRRWVALGLRSALVGLLVLALAEVRLNHESEIVTVLFVLDRSQSVPEELEADPRTSRTIDRRFERIKEFINDSVRQRGSGHERDRAGLIVFGRQPRLELQPSDAPRLNFTEVASPIDGSNTDIAAALKLALASFPEGSARRIVLISDGNETLGDALAQARLAKQNRVEIDVLPLAAGLRNENEVLVESVAAPPLVEQGSQLPVTVLIRSFNPNIVVGVLHVNQICEGISTPVPDSPQRVFLKPGTNPFVFKQGLSDQQHSYTYEARFEPEFVQDQNGNKLVEGLPGSRPQNKRATTHVVARGRRRILLLEDQADEQKFLATHLKAAGNGKFEVTELAAGALPGDREQLGLFLSDFDCVILADVPAELFSEDQAEMLRSNTYDQGCGLVMIGGPNGFGAGGWQGTAVEKALPVDAELRALQLQGKGGLVLIMHASEMREGNMWQKKIAKLAVEKLGPSDEVGVLYFDWGKTIWHIPLQPILERRADLLAKIDAMSPGDMPDFDPGLKMAYEALTDPAKDFATKHVIIISDGDPVQADPLLLPRMRQDKVTVSTVGVATHDPANQALTNIARATGGKPYNPKSPAELPAIYTKETRKVSQAFVYEKPFQPNLVSRGGPTAKLPPLPPLTGFVRTTPKASPGVEMPIKSPAIAEQDFPILAHWHYGLGKAVAFTSDAARHPPPDNKFWARDWAESAMYAKFWEQIIDWSLRPVESKRLVMTADYRDGKVRIVVDARDENNQPLTNLNLKVGITPPDARASSTRKAEMRLRQTNSGIYEGEFKAEDAGSYFLNATATKLVPLMKDGKEVLVEEGFDSVRVGVTIPYSQEFATTETNTELLEALRRETGGERYEDDAEALARVARSGQVFRSGLEPAHGSQPIWYWLLFLAGMVLFFDVAVRRIALDPAWLTERAQRGWDRMRGRTVAVETTPQFLDRLRTRKAEVEEELERSRGQRRFEGGDAPVVAPPRAADAPPTSVPPRPPPRPPGVAPEPEQEAGDYASRLMKAKKRVWKEREKE
jgi:uncharacterized membrane protein